MKRTTLLRGFRFFLFGTLALTAPAPLSATGQAEQNGAAQQNATKPAPEDIYTLQHQLLPGILFSDKGSLLFNDLFSGKTAPFIAMVQEPLGTRYTSGIGFSREHLDNSDVVLISFAPPFTEPNCLHAALVRQGDTFRYITLEFGNTVEKVRSTAFLCEWTPDFRHINYGARNYDDLKSFRSELLTILRKPAKDKP